MLISARRFLLQIGYFRSCAHNGKCHPLRSRRRFDRDGLRHNRETGCSRHGSLPAQIGHWIGRPPGGLYRSISGE